MMSNTATPITIQSHGMPPGRESTRCRLFEVGWSVGLVLGEVLEEAEDELCDG